MKTITIKRPKAFDIKETDSIEKIEEMQKQLKEYIIKLKNLYDAIEEFKKEKTERVLHDRIFIAEYEP